jgi:hypothetical protein
MRDGHIYLEAVVDKQWSFGYIFIYRSINNIKEKHNDGPRR